MVFVTDTYNMLMALMIETHAGRDSVKVGA